MRGPVGTGVIVRRRVGASALLVVGLHGCAPDAPPTGDAAVLRRDSAGTEIVVNRSSAWGGEERWTLAPEPSVRIGALASSDPAYQFSRIHGVLRLSDGRIVVLDGEASEVRWFDAEGNHLYSAGREGAGPGEFNFARWAFRLDGDTVLVEDRPRIKHVFFGPDGTFVREEVLDYAGLGRLGAFEECGGFTLPDRSLVRCVAEEGQPPRVTSPPPGRLRWIGRLVRIPWDLSSVDTLGLYGGIEQWGVSYGGRTEFAMHPFHSWTRTAVRDDPVRVAVAINPEYSIEIWTPDGRLERIVRREGARRAPTSEEIALARERLAMYARGDDALADRLRSEIPTPDTVPAAGGLHFTETGELLVRRQSWSDEGAEPVRHDVFDATGRWLGEFRHPRGLRIEAIGRDYALMVRRDELDVPYVELYELNREK